MLTEKPEKRKQTFLSNKQRWELAKYLIERRHIIQNIDPKTMNKYEFVPFTIWIAKKTYLVKEIKHDLDIDVSPHHIDQAIAFYHEICELTKEYPKVPAIQDTVQMDMLTVENKRLKKDLTEITEQFSKSQQAYDRVQKTLTELMSKMHAISQLIPAECFNIKRHILQK